MHLIPSTIFVPSVSLMTILSLATPLYAAQPMQVRLADFSSTTNHQITLGDEYPGAKGQLIPLEEDGNVFNRLDFDLTQGGYVGHLLPVNIAEGATSLTLTLRATSTTDKAILNFRVQDATGQEHLARVPLPLDETWHDYTFTFNDFVGHWGGAKDNAVHWPLRVIMVGISTKGIGHLDIRDAIMTTTSTTQPLDRITCKTARIGAFFYPDEPIPYQLDIHGNTLNRNVEYHAAVTVTDWQDTPVLSLRMEHLKADVHPLVLTAEQLKGRFGTFKLTVEVHAADQPDISHRIETWFARLTSAPAGHCPWIGTGIHPAHGWINYDYRFLDVLDAIGIGIIRDSMNWAKIEQERGVYKVPDATEAMVNALNARGIRLNIILASPNKIYDNPLDPKAFAAWAGFLASHFKGRITTFEIWNEPHNMFFMKHYGDSLWAGKFVELSRMGAEAIHEADPNVNVALTAEDYQPFLEKLLLMGIATDRDMVSIHPYCHGQPRPEHEWFFRDNGEFHRALARRNGGCSRFCITEAGWTTYQGDMKYLEVAGGYPRSSYVHQAQYITRMLVLSRQMGLDYACQYDFMNDGPQANYTEDNFGLVRGDLTPKPAASAVAFLARFLGDAEPLGDLSYDPEKFRLYHFRRQDGQDVIFAYAVQDAINVALPSGWDPRPVRCIDLQGNPAPIPLKENTLTLTELPVYLTGCSADAFATIPRFAIAFSDIAALIGSPLQVSVTRTREGGDVSVQFKTEDGRTLPLKTPPPRHPEGAPLTDVFDFTMDPQILRPLIGQSILFETTLTIDGIRSTKIRSIPLQESILVNAGGVQLRDGRPTAVIQLENNSADARQAHITLSAPTMNAPLKRELQFSPHGSQILTLHMDRLPADGDALDVQVTFTDGSTPFQQTVPLFSAAIPSIPAPADFRGNWDDWKDTLALAVKPVLFSLAKPPIQGDDDLSAVVKVACDDQGIRIAVRVTDDHFFQPFSTSDNIWDGDSIQLSMASMDCMHRMEICVASLPQGPKVVCCSKFPAVSNEAAQVTAACTALSDTCMLYEVLIPWKALPGVRPMGQVRLSLLVNDNDGKGRRGWLEFHSGIGKTKDATQHGIYSF